MSRIALTTPRPAEGYEQRMVRLLEGARGSGRPRGLRRFGSDQPVGGCRDGASVEGDQGWHRPAERVGPRRRWLPWWGRGGGRRLDDDGSGPWWRRPRESGQVDVVGQGGCGVDPGYAHRWQPEQLDDGLGDGR